MIRPMRLARSSIALLAAPLLVAAAPAEPDAARVTAAKLDIANLKVALSMFELDTGAFPTTKQGLAVLARPAGGHAAYIDHVPTDPWGHHAYVYRSPGTNKADYDLLSCGPDGREGGGDDVR